MEIGIRVFAIQKKDKILRLMSSIERCCEDLFWRFEHLSLEIVIGLRSPFDGDVVFSAKLHKIFSSSTTSAVCRISDVNTSALDGGTLRVSHDISTTLVPLIW
jgi:hypothetical protein